MPCFHPLTAYYSKEVGASGKRGITFTRNTSHTGVAMKLPCGQCIGCRLERSRQWAVRCMHERQLHRDSAMVTLTYDPAKLPPGGSLVKRDFQLFMKRLRKEYGDGIRYFACGEYGSNFGRPHYHAILFNFNAGDVRQYKVTDAGNQLYTSQRVEKIWGNGFCVLNAVTFDSCAYVARYIMKKITGDGADAHYQGREPEFTLMSRRPGIGAGWYAKYGEHAYKFDSVIMNGREVRPPRFYDTRYEVVDSDHLSELKVKRRRVALMHREDNTPERRKVREEVARRALQEKRRTL